MVIPGSISKTRLWICLQVLTGKYTQGQVLLTAVMATGQSPPGKDGLPGDTAQALTVKELCTYP